MNWRNFAIMIMLAALSGPGYSEVVLESDDNAATLTGTWSQSQAVAGYYGSDFATAGVGGGTVDTARFFSQRAITTSGTWCIQARWTAGSNRSASAQYQVFDGTTLRSTFPADQRANGGAWRRLGCAQLTAGKISEVRLLDTGGAAGSIVVADGVRWVYEETPGQGFCVNVAGGPANGGATFVGQGYSLPPNGACKAWSGFMKTGSTVVGFSSGSGCTSSNGKVFTATLSTSNPSFFGPGKSISDHIQLCTAGAAGCPVGATQFDSGSFFNGTAERVSCTSTMLQLPAVHD